MPSKPTRAGLCQSPKRVRNYPIRDACAAHVIGKEPLKDYNRRSFLINLKETRNTSSQSCYIISYLIKIKYKNYYKR